jgi:hypothetical protein
VENENLVDPDSEPIAETPPPARDALALPLAIALVALLVFFGFQTLQLYSDRTSLRSVKTNQESAIQEAQKVQAQFKTILSKTTELANQGHPGARFVVEELQKRGVGVAPAMPPVMPDVKPVPPAGK